MRPLQLDDVRVYTITRNTLHCDQTNVYSSRFFSRLFLKICFFCSFSVYRRLATSTLAYEISFESPSLQIRDRGQSMVCVHTYTESDNTLLRYGRLKFPRWLPAAILNLIQPEMAPLDPPSPKTPVQNQTRSRSDDASLRYGRLKFSQNV